MTRIYSCLGQQLAHIREKAGLTQKAIAKKMHRTQSAISKLENADDISIADLSAYAHACGQQLKFEFKDKEDAPKPKKKGRKPDPLRGVPILIDNLA